MLVCLPVRDRPSLDFVKAANTQIKPVLAFMVPVDTSAGKLAVVMLAVAFLIGFILWSKQTKSASFFRGVLAGMGFVLSVDIVLVHWIFGLHHITNTQMDIVLEPCLSSSDSFSCGLRSRESTTLLESCAQM
jgi:hypothetical protein